MRPARDFSLLSDSKSEFVFINEVVNALCLLDSPPHWSEIVSEFSDDWNYLSISIDKRPGYELPCLLMEYGVQSLQSRRATGCLLARWSVSTGEIEGLETILLHGCSVDISEFSSHLVSYLDLPKVLRSSVFTDTH